MPSKIKSPIQKVIAINDLSCYGRASLTIAIPTLSAMGVQVCPLPTALLSSQTSGVEDYTFLDLTEELYKILAHWKSLNLSFDAVYSGFLGSTKQVELVSLCHKQFLKESGLFLVDPVLGDEGKFYIPQMQDLVAQMRKLVHTADIISPNLTETCFLLDEPYSDNFSQEQLKEFLFRLANLEEEGFAKELNLEAEAKNKQKTVLITSAPLSQKEKKGSASEKMIKVVAYESGNEKFWQTKTPRINAFYPGTGDTYASVLLGCLLQKDSVPMAMARAARYVYECILVTHGYNLPFVEGIMLEKTLPELGNLNLANYEEF